MTALERIVELASALGPDEQSVLSLIAGRLLAGRTRYGELDVASDGRRFDVEAIEEAADGLVYAACALMRHRCHGEEDR